MKNLKTISVLSALMLSLLIGVNSSSAATLATTLKGRILLQVEQNGEAWYVNPTNELRYYLGRPADAFNIMRELGLGISNKDFDSFNGYAPSRLSGRILLKVADSGKAYYVNTNDLKMYYLGRPSDAFNVMRELGLGITDKNLSLINMANNKYTNQQYGFEFQYSANFKISTFKPGDINKIFGLKISDPGDSLILVSNNEDGNKMLKDDKNKLIATYGADPEAKLEIKDFFIGTSPAFSANFYNVTVSDTDGGKHSTPNLIIETYKNNYFYVLETASITSTMFSTFKFTDSVNASGIIKSVYSKSGKNYIDIDYVEFNPNWIPGGSTGWAYQNNPLRTFEISPSAKFVVGSPATDSITFSDFQKYFTTSDTPVYQKDNPWDIVIANGVVTKITEHFVP